MECLLIDGTFGFTIEANLLESFTGQRLLKGEEGASATGKIKPSTELERGKLNAQSFYDRRHTKHKYPFSFLQYSPCDLASHPS